MAIIAPSVLSADFSRLGEEINTVVAAGADWIHLDVMDGHFVPNITIGPPVIKSLRQLTNLHFDVHLMITQPERYLEDFAKAGANTISVHAEVSPHLHRTLHEIRRLGCQAGGGLKPVDSARTHRICPGRSRYGPSYDGEPGFWGAGIHQCHDTQTYQAPAGN